MNGSLDQTLMRTPIGGWLFPFGYAANSDHRIEHLMQTVGSPILLDIRLNARSRWYSQWNKSALMARWESRYVHERRLGNVNYQYVDRPIELLDPEAALPWILERLQQDAILLVVCGCRDYDRCHRKTVTEFILQRCRDSVRTSGMRFDLERGVYVGVCRRVDLEMYGLVLQDGQMHVCVVSQVFEQYRSYVGGDVLYQVSFWISVAYESPDLATLEQVDERELYGC